MPDSRRRVFAIVLLLAAVLGTVASGGATVCEHPDGSRNVGWVAGGIGCHGDDAAEPGCPADCLAGSCHDGRVQAAHAARPPGPDTAVDDFAPHLPIPFPCRAPQPGAAAGLPRAGLYANALKPPNARLVAISTVVLLV